MKGRTIDGSPLKPGYNVDLVDVEAGLAELVLCGYTCPMTREVIAYNLLRHSKGEEEAAQKAAIDSTFHGITLTCWFRVLAAAIAVARANTPEAKAKAEAEIAAKKVEAAKRLEAAQKAMAAAQAELVEAAKAVGE